MRILILEMKEQEAVEVDIMEELVEEIGISQAVEAQDT